MSDDQSASVPTMRLLEPPVRLKVRSPAVKDATEPVGGNIVLPRNGRPYSITANFHTGADKRRGMISIEFENLHCAEDAPSP